MTMPSARYPFPFWTAAYGVVGSVRMRQSGNRLGFIIW